MSERALQANALCRNALVRSVMSHTRFGGHNLERKIMMLVICCLIGLLTGCGSPTTLPTGTADNAASVTVNAKATADAQRVLIQINASSSGTIAADSLEITAETTVTNQTGQTVYLAHYAAVTCLPPPPLIFSLVSSDKKTVWQETHSDSCPLSSVYDVATIPAGGSKQWTTTFNLQYFLAHSASALSPGTYTLTAAGLLWHEGTISANGNTSSPHGYAGGQTMVTIQ